MELTTQEHSIEVERTSKHYPKIWEAKLSYKNSEGQDRYASQTLDIIWIKWEEKRDLPEKPSSRRDVDKKRMEVALEYLVNRIEKEEEIEEILDFRIKESKTVRKQVTEE